MTSPDFGTFWSFKPHKLCSAVNVLINRFQPFGFCEELTDSWQTAGTNSLISSHKVMYPKYNLDLLVDYKSPSFR